MLQHNSREVSYPPIFFLIFLSFIFLSSGFRRQSPAWPPTNGWGEYGKKTGR
jgi:hypothetical protein